MLKKGMRGMKLVFLESYFCERFVTNRIAVLAWKWGYELIYLSMFWYKKEEKRCDKKV